MHSPRKKEQRTAEPPASPTHSRPRGLEPVVIDDVNWRELEQAAARDDPPGGIVADYLYVEPDPQWPRLTLRLARRGEHETDEQYAGYQRDIEQFNCNHAIYLGLCQLLCTHLGNHRKCRQGPCRRNGACAGIRDQDRFDIPLVLFPPCVPLDHEIIETYRMEIIAEIKRVVARGNGDRPQAEPATAGRRLPSVSKDGARAAGQPPETGGGKAGKRKDHRSLPVARPAKTA